MFVKVAVVHLKDGLTQDEPYVQNAANLLTYATVAPSTLQNVIGVATETSGKKRGRDLLLLMTTEQYGFHN